MFEMASRLKLRFNHKGSCSTEDLWDLSVIDLDGIFKKLNSELKVQQEESLLDIKSKHDKITELKISIVKHIVGIKIQEKEDAENKFLKAERKQKLLRVINEKQDADLYKMSVEDLNKLINSL